MGRLVVDGILALLEEHVDVTCRRTLGRGLRVSLVMCCMQRVRVFVFDSGMTLGVALFLWKIYIWKCLLVLWIKKLGFLIWLILHLMGVVEARTYFSVVNFRIGRRRFFMISLWISHPNYLGGGGDDTMIWQLNCSGFLMCSLSIIHCWKLCRCLFPGRAFGVLRYLKGWLFFLWTAARGGILTIDKLVKKNLPLVNWCCLCWCEKEIVDHLLLHCKFAHTSWSEFFL